MLEKEFEAIRDGLSTVTALGGLNLRDAEQGHWSWSAGIGGISLNEEISNAFSAGVIYGITDGVGVFTKISRPLRGVSGSAYFIGIEGRF
ncbi:MULTISPECIES: hypothetical protein [unclassified Yoonia]|uniref:hypothetical protein n=1 Tax=unclassified Yoonia TaxID=2629118 RepID=UPI002AFFD2E9|nr:MULTISPECIES: hypothetical protein [unclassified Yoonia]